MQARESRVWSHCQRCMTKHWSNAKCTNASTTPVIIKKYKKILQVQHRVHQTGNINLINNCAQTCIMAPMFCTG